MSLAGVAGGVDFGRSGAEKYSDPGVSGPTGVSFVICSCASSSGGVPLSDVVSVVGEVTRSSILDFDGESALEFA